MSENKSHHDHAWAVANLHTLARREIRRLSKELTDKGGTGTTPATVAIHAWEHVIRICEEVGVPESSVLRTPPPQPPTSTEALAAELVRRADPAGCTEEPINGARIDCRTWHVGRPFSRWCRSCVLREAASALSASVREQEGPPGRWICRTCGFQVTRAILRAHDGAVGVDSRELQDICPNDGSSMQRLTWKEDAEDANRVGLEQMKRAEQAEAHAAALVKTLEELCRKWWTEAKDIHADGDYCCGKTRQHDADELEAALHAPSDPAASVDAGERLNLQAIAKDASERAAKNSGAAPQLLYAPILWALQDAISTAAPPKAETPTATETPLLEALRSLSVQWRKMAENEHVEAATELERCADELDTIITGASK